MRVDGTHTDEPPKEPPAEVPPPPAEVPPPLVEPHSSIEAKLLKSIWLVISSFNDRGMTSVDIRSGFYTVHGPFGDHINEMFDMFDEYREQLELIRNNLIEAAREVDAGTRCIFDEMEPRYRGPVRRVQRSMVEEINHSFDSLRIGIGYDSERHLVNENVSDDEASLFSSVDESADENESEQMKMSSE
jgi:hypothetical protein